MNTKYPALVALIGLMAAVGKDFAAQNESIIQKLSGAITIVPQALAFIPLSSGLGAEITSIKSIPEDEVALGELLINDLGFSSPKAISIIAAAYPVAEKIAGSISDIKVLIEAIKA